MRGRAYSAQTTKTCLYLPNYSEVAFGIINLYHSFVLWSLPMSSLHAATACDPSTPHHGSEPIDKE